MGNICTCNGEKVQHIPDIFQPKQDGIYTESEQTHQNKTIIHYPEIERQISNQESITYTTNVQMNQSNQQRQVQYTSILNSLNKQYNDNKIIEVGNINSSNKSQNSSSGNQNQDDLLNVQFLQPQNNQGNIVNNQQEVQNNNQPNKQYVETQKNLLSTNI